MKPIYVVFEGIDGCGKTTQIELLKKWFDDNDYPVLVTKTPGGTDLGKKMRKILLDKSYQIDKKTELLLFGADHHEANIMIKNTLKEKSVICDRGFYSTIAYQGFGNGFPLDFILRVGDVIEIEQPDFVFFLDIPLKPSIKRRKGDDRYESRNDAFYERVIKGYYECVNMYDRFIFINGVRSIEDIHAEIVETVMSKLKEN